MKKEIYLKQAYEHITSLKVKIAQEIEKTKVGISIKMASAKIEDKWTNASVKAMRENRLEQLEIMNNSPYFNKCECSFEGKPKTYYFGKFSLAEESVYSWIVPAATMRFENPGNISYKLPDGRIRKGEMFEKDQYMIVDGKILFFTKEQKDKAKELIHQEHFSSRKNGFMLPEIVSVMEKAQDLIIRAHHKGSFAISGPAGSGKTTLALHRVAYLVQSPDTAEYYPSDRTIVFVQDTGTKKYFSALLPELGIHNVEITTFFEWAGLLLPLEGVTLVSEFNNKKNKELYAFEKIQTLRSKEIPKWSNNIFSLLSSYYGENFKEQQKQKILDRIDITVLLQSYINHKKKFETIRRFTRSTQNGFVNKSEKKLLKYPLMVIDEFQNYMPEQINILKKCLDKETGSVVYVGDMAQQVRLGTIKSWSDVEEDIKEERNVKLYKVYRNTKQIMGYINKLGFNVEIPEGLKEGPEVKEIPASSREDVVTEIKNLIKGKQTGQTLGIIGKEKDDVEYLKETFKEEGVHICTMIESQGVEFDTVCLILSKISSEEERDSFPQTFIDEVKKVQKDLLYVALTRAIQEMVVININGNINL
jgi:DNA helicase IV